MNKIENSSYREALQDLGAYLRERGYRFITVTPESHRRYFERQGAAILASSDFSESQILRALFGWNQFVPDELLPQKVKRNFRLLGVAPQREGWRSPVRFSTLDAGLFAHSAYPTTDHDSVFFGPDSYRFVRYVRSRIHREARTLADVGCGTGVGGLCAAEGLSGLQKIYLTDVNEKALLFAGVNARLAAVDAEIFSSDLFQNVPSSVDVIIANPPFISDTEQRFYRHGGGERGEEISLRIVEEALEHLKPGGQLLLYTGSCIVDGRDFFRERVESLARGCELSYEEIDPDIFGEELMSPAYRGSERIAAVGLNLRTSSPRR